MSRGGIDGPSCSRHESESGIYGERMTDQVSVTREIGAPAAQVWAMVSDVTRMGEWSPENEGGEWLHGASGPEPGARFRGTNRNGKKQWKTVATIVESQPGRVFSFRVTAPGLKVAEWRYEFEATAIGCRVTETWIDQRGVVVKTLGKPVSGVADRAGHNRAGMEQTLERLAAAAESAESPSRRDDGEGPAD
jgi:uncharacterized protein YndB with AHSA1/START domain